MTTVAEHFQISPCNPLVNTKEFACGCEFEIENIKSHGPVQGHPMFHVDIDHSLRNNGHEYKTTAADYKTTLELFKFLHKQVQYGKDAFSERTSIHVHVNARMLELQTVRQLVLSYALLEPLFFNLVGDKRKNNIFCVPLNYTFLPEYYKGDIKKIHGAWQKYTAFNILPLGPNQHTAALGTIEYRHLYGTNNYELFEKWIDVLRHFHTFFAEHPEYDVLGELYKGTPVYHIAKTLVPRLVEGLAPYVVQEMLKDSLIDVKLATGGLAK